MVKNYLNFQTIQTNVNADDESASLQATKDEFASIQKAIANMKKRTVKLAMKLILRIQDIPNERLQCKMQLNMTLLTSKFCD